MYLFKCKKNLLTCNSRTIITPKTSHLPFYSHHLSLVFHVSKPKPFDADKAWQDHIDRVSKREPYYPSGIFHTTYPFSRYPLYLVYSKRPPPPSDIKFDPHRAWLDHLDRLAELDKIYPSLFPLSSYRGLSPTPTKVTERK